jgi:GNAT superfamily N-acetyltransferase
MEPQGVKIFEEFAAAEAIRSRDAIGSSTYVALDGARLLGVLHIKDGSHIALLFVLPAFHKQGIGRALIQVADQSSKLLTVHSSTNATNSYASYGFGACGPEQLSNGIRFVPMQRNSV